MSQTETPPPPPSMDPGHPGGVDSRALYRAQKRTAGSGLSTLMLGGVSLAHKLVYKMVQAGCPSQEAKDPPGQPARLQGPGDED